MSETTISGIALLTGLDRLQDLYDSLEVGDNILVRFGSRGSQAAYVQSRTRGGKVRVFKYRAKSRSYTKPVTIDPLDIIQKL